MRISRNEVNSLLIIDSSGNVLFENDLNAYSISFSPDESKIAVIIGERIPEHDVGFTSKALLIIDISTGESRQILTASPRPEDWMRHLSGLDSLTWWMRQVIWDEDSVLYLSCFEHFLMINPFTSEIIRNMRSDLRCEVGGALSVSPDHNYLLRGPCSTSKLERTVEVLDIYTLERKSDLILQAFGDTLRTGFYDITARWVGMTGATLVIDVRPGRAYKYRVGEAGLSTLMSTIKVLDIKANVIIDDIKNPDFSLRTPPWRIPPYVDNFFRQGKIVKAQDVGLILERKK